MKLEKQHRESLLASLDKAKSELAIFKKAMQLHNEEDVMKKSWEIDIFLEQERIILIEQSLINNEIDF